ncbi:hypothetical protein ACLOAV_010826 [Pseudogymnoascus australis]
MFVGNATTILEWEGIRLMTDPNFLHAGDHVHLGPGVTSVRLKNPAIDLYDLPRIDAVLLSHYHEDHFDRGVEASLRRSLPIISTHHAKEHLSSKPEGEAFTAVYDLNTYESLMLDIKPNSSSSTQMREFAAIKVTAMPGKHVPPGILSTVNDFIKAATPDDAFQCGYRIYISGDTLMIDELKCIPERYGDKHIDLMLIHLGGTTIPGPNMPLLMVTMDAFQGLQLLQLVKPDITIPIHYDDYDVFRGPLKDFKQAVRDAGLENKVVYLDRKDQYKLPRISRMTDESQYRGGTLEMAMSREKSKEKRTMYAGAMRLCCHLGILEGKEILRMYPLFRGSYNGGTPLPDVLSSPKLMKATDLRGVNCQAAFEGTSPQAVEDSETRNEGLPHNLCLSQHHTSSKKNRLPKTTFDIDSTCCFPTSLGFARHGIHWLPKVHAYLNLKADIHFGLRVPGYTSNGKASLRYVPLHKIPHYCLGTLIGMNELQLFIFFPALHEESDYEHSTYLSSRDEQLWLDAIHIPCITKVVDCYNILEQYPASARIANLDSLAISAEGFARKESSREQLLRHAIQPQHLDPLWTLILETIEDSPGLHRFRGATLFSNAKNTKVEYNRKSLTQAYEVWEQRWSDATNPEFYNKDQKYVDLAKQVTSKDSAVPYDQIPEDHEADVFLWKKCCLDAYSRTRAVVNVDGSKAKGNPRQTAYSWATMRDTMGLTLFAAPRGAETRDGLIYSQFYGSIKTPFDSSKVYVFDNDSVENLAFDPGYVRSLQQEGGGITFSKGVCEFAYLSSKKRAHANLLDNRWRSYGVREEHRISLSMMEEIYQQWVQWDLYDADDVSGSSSPLPYYIVPTDELLGFLYVQINKYCFLFEHVLAHTARTYSLPETMAMVGALRFCYGSSLLIRESLLYKNRWEVRRGEKLVVKEGLGMRESMERCGLGWFLPKFNWNTWRLAPPHGDNILVGNLTMHEEYKRRWRAVKDLRDVYIRFNQAESWHEQYNMQDNQGLEKVWLEYLIALNLEQFDVDVQRAMMTANKRSNELRPDAAQSIEAMKFCHHDMRKMFMVDGEAAPPHMVTGNKMRFEKVMDVLNFLFMWDEQERPGWGNKPYRVILQKTFEMLERRLGYRRADNWLGEFLHVVRLTHWVLPYPSNGAFITSTKASHRQGLKRRMMWFSFVYANPKFVELPFRGPSSSMSRVLWQAGRQTSRKGREQQVWGISQLLAAVRAQGVEESGEEEYWVSRRISGLKELVPLWERGQPPRLKMLEQIRKKTLDELDSFMAELSQAWAGQDLGGGVSSGSDDDAEADADRRRPAATVARGNIMAAFAKGGSSSNWYEDDLRRRSGSSASVGSHS